MLELQGELESQTISRISLCHSFHCVYNGGVIVVALIFCKLITNRYVTLASFPRDDKVEGEMEARMV